MHSLFGTNAVQVCHTQNGVNVMWERCTCCQQRGKSQVSYNAACGGGRIDLHSTANARLHLCTVFTASCDVLSSARHRGVVLHRGRACAAAAVRRRSFHAEDDVCHSLDQCTTPLRRSRWNGFTSAEGIILVPEDMTQSARRTLQHSREARLHQQQDHNGRFRKINVRRGAGPTRRLSS